MLGKRFSLGTSETHVYRHTFLFDIYTQNCVRTKIPHHCVDNLPKTEVEKRQRQREMLLERRYGIRGHPCSVGTPRGSLVDWLQDKEAYADHTGRRFPPSLPLSSSSQTVQGVNHEDIQPIAASSQKYFTQNSETEPKGCTKSAGASVSSSTCDNVSAVRSATVYQGGKHTPVLGSRSATFPCPVEVASRSAIDPGNNLNFHTRQHTLSTWPSDQPIKEDNFYEGDKHVPVLGSECMSFLQELRSQESPSIAVSVLEEGDSTSSPVSPGTGFRKLHFTEPEKPDSSTSSRRGVTPVKEANFCGAKQTSVLGSECMTFLHQFHTQGHKSMAFRTQGTDGNRHRMRENTSLGMLDFHEEKQSENSTVSGRGVSPVKKTPTSFLDSESMALVQGKGDNNAKSLSRSYSSSCTLGVLQNRHSDASGSNYAMLAAANRAAKPENNEDTASSSLGIQSVGDRRILNRNVQIPSLTTNHFVESDEHSEDDQYRNLHSDEPIFTRDPLSSSSTTFIQERFDRFSSSPNLPCMDWSNEERSNIEEKFSLFDDGISLSSLGSTPDHDE